MKKQQISTMQLSWLDMVAQEEKPEDPEDYTYPKKDAICTEMPEIAIREMIIEPDWDIEWIAYCHLGKKEVFRQACGERWVYLTTTSAIINNRVWLVHERLCKLSDMFGKPAVEHDSEM